MKQGNGCKAFDGWEELESLLLWLIRSVNMIMLNLGVIIAHEIFLTNLQLFPFLDAEA